MTEERLSEKVMEQSGQIAEVNASVRSAHKRIDENDKVIYEIHKLAANVESLALQVKLITESVSNSVMRLENSIKSQGERIGTLEKEPGNKWKTLLQQITSLIVAALIGGKLSNLF